MDKLTQSIQDYLKTIYEIMQDNSFATTTELADRLDVAPASVTGMLQRLASYAPPLVDYKKHQGARLTPAGERAALEVIRHHRLLETYLVNALGYRWDQVHEEACQLEHVISEDFEARIDEALGYPLRDPHGDLIPSPALTMPSDNSRPLSDLRPGEALTVKRISGADPALLRHLLAIGIVPEARVIVEAYSEFDGNLTLQVEGQMNQVVLGTSISSRVFVEKMLDLTL
jgi:DtxR family Mn-dependent transcriptional regulator